MAAKPTTKPKAAPAKPKFTPGKPQQMMTRADSLKSMAEFGKIVSPAMQAQMKAKKKKPRIPFISDITDALGGK